MVTEAVRYVWIATADIKDLYVKRGNRMVPFLSVLSHMIEQGISIRLIHAREPGPNFRKDFDRFPPLIKALERMLCPRVRFKSVIVDGKKAYTGSANLTGAGMGAKSENRRNFESGILTDDPIVVNHIMNQFDQVWVGAHCDPCRRKQYCSDRPIKS
jgi:PLD-like domain